MCYEKQSHHHKKLDAENVGFKFTSYMLMCPIKSKANIIFLQGQCSTFKMLIALRPKRKKMEDLCIWEDFWDDINRFVSVKDVIIASFLRIFLSELKRDRSDALIRKPFAPLISCVTVGNVLLRDDSLAKIMIILKNWFEVFLGEIDDPIIWRSIQFCAFDCALCSFSFKSIQDA